MKDLGVSKREAVKELWKVINSAWKDINEDCLRRPTEVPLPFLTRVLNLTRFIEVIYKENDSFTYPEGATKEHVKLLFVDPVSI